MFLGERSYVDGCSCHSLFLKKFDIFVSKTVWPRGPWMDFDKVCATVDFSRFQATDRQSTSILDYFDDDVEHFLMELFRSGLGKESNYLFMTMLMT